MSSDRETRRRLEEVQQRLAGIEAEVALEESPGFAEELRHLEDELSLVRGRGQRGEARLGEAQRELGGAAAAVEQLELAAQARQSNHIDDILGAAAGAVMIAIIGVAAFLARDQSLDLEWVITLGSCCSAALGAVLRARVVRPKR